MLTEGGVEVDDLDADRISGDEEPSSAAAPPPSARPMVIDVTELPSDSEDDDCEIYNEECHQALKKLVQEVSPLGSRCDAERATE